MISFLFTFFLLSQDKFLVQVDLRLVSSATPVFALHLQVVCRHSDPRLCVLACIRAAALYTSLLSVFRLVDRRTVGSYVSLWDKIFTKVPHGRESKVHLTVRPQGNRLPHFPTLCTSYGCTVHCFVAASAKNN